MAVKKKTDAPERDWDTTTPETGNYCVHCGAYEPSAQLRFSTDKRGHSSAIYARVPQDVPSQIETIVQSGKFGFKTVQEFVREAVFHRMFYYRKLMGEPNVMLDSTLARLNTINKMIEEENAQMRFQSDFLKLKETLNFLRTTGGDEGRVKARLIVMDLMEKVDGIPDKFWRALWTGMLASEFPDLVSKGA